MCLYCEKKIDLDTGEVLEAPLLIEDGCLIIEESGEYGGHHRVGVPINYCPMCGDKI